jgi:transcription elongation factor GreA
MNNDKVYLTAEGARRLKDELEELSGPRRQDLARRLRVAIQQGDLSENADYIAAKEEQGFLEGRIQELEQTLRHAEIIQDSDGRRDQVDLGAVITIQEAAYPPEKYRMVGAKEANPREGRISNESPIGEALMGRRVGDMVTVSTPNGDTRIKILSID